MTSRANAANRFFAPEPAPPANAPKILKPFAHNSCANVAHCCGTGQTHHPGLPAQDMAGMR
jgi:hypothetical protein